MDEISRIRIPRASDEQLLLEILDYPVVHSDSVRFDEIFEDIHNLTWSISALSHHASNLADEFEELKEFGYEIENIGFKLQDVIRRLADDLNTQRNSRHGLSTIRQSFNICIETYHQICVEIRERVHWSISTAQSENLPFYIKVFDKVAQKLPFELYKGVWTEIANEYANDFEQESDLCRNWVSMTILKCRFVRLYLWQYLICLIFAFKMKVPGIIINFVPIRCKSYFKDASTIISVLLNKG